MRLAGYQPQYFPRLHYFNRMLNSEITEISDYLQFVKKHSYQLPDGSMKRGKSFQAHIIIKLSTGTYTLAIPTADTLLPINVVAPVYLEDWAQKHLKTMESAFGKAVNFKRFYPEISEILNRQYKSISDLNTKTIIWGVIRLLTDEPINIRSLSLTDLNNRLKLQKIFRLKKIVLASETSIPAPNKGEANDWIISLCKHLGADEYIYGGTSSVAYMDPEKFKNAGIQIVIQDWKCPQYNQQFPQIGFIPNLSVLDLVFNENLLTRQSVIKGKD